MTEDRRRKGGSRTLFLHANFSLPLHSPVTILSSSTVSLKSHFRSGRIHHPPRPQKPSDRPSPPPLTPHPTPPAPTEPIHRAPFVGPGAPGVGGGRKEEGGGTTAGELLIWGLASDKARRCKKGTKRVTDSSARRSQQRGKGEKYRQRGGGESGNQGVGGGILLSCTL